MKEILDIVHSDVFGPVKVPSLGKSMYYVSFIDDFSRNTWIYFPKKKSEVFDRFKEFKALVENQTEKKIKVAILATSILHQSTIPFVCAPSASETVRCQNMDGCKLEFL